jgi:hypothetical protein
MTTSTTPGPAPIEPAVAANTPAGDRLRQLTPAVGLALGAITIAVLLVLTPWGERNALGYDDIAPVRDAAWLGMLLDGAAFGVVGVTLGLVACFLAQGRGRVAALVGAVLTTVGGILFAMGEFGFATLAWYATSEAISTESGRALMSYVEDNPAHFYGVTGAGFLAFMIGTLVISAALIRARAVPVAGVVAFIVLTLAQFSPIPGRALDFVQISLMVLLVGLAGRAIQRR